ADWQPWPRYSRPTAASAPRSAGDQCDRRCCGRTPTPQHLQTGEELTMRHTESKSQQAFIRWWGLSHRSLGVPHADLLFAIPNGGARNPVTGATLKAEGVRRGVPDLFLAVPRINRHFECRNG